MLNILIAVLSLFLVGCIHAPRLARPENCSPSPEEVTCSKRSYKYGPDPSDPFGQDASGFICFKPEDIEPFLERCGD